MFHKICLGIKVYSKELATGFCGCQWAENGRLFVLVSKKAAASTTYLLSKYLGILEIQNYARSLPERLQHNNNVGIEVGSYRMRNAQLPSVTARAFPQNQRWYCLLWLQTGT